jgi:hypothetical protein
MEHINRRISYACGRLSHDRIHLVSACKHLGEMCDVRSEIENGRDWHSEAMFEGIPPRSRFAFRRFGPGAALRINLVGGYFSL